MTAPTPRSVVPPALPLVLAAGDVSITFSADLDDPDGIPGVHVEIVTGLEDEEGGPVRAALVIDEPCELRAIRDYLTYALGEA